MRAVNIAEQKKTFFSPQKKSSTRAKQYGARERKKGKSFVIKFLNDVEWNIHLHTFQSTLSFPLCLRVERKCVFCVCGLAGA